MLFNKVESKTYHRTKVIINQALSTFQQDEIKLKPLNY